MRYGLTWRKPGVLPLLILVIALAGAACQVPSGEPTAGPPRVLVMSKTAGFRHGCIPAGVEAVRALGARHGFTVDATEDADVFSPQQLARYDVVVFMNTTGDILDPRQEAALESFIRNGGGFVGIHAATDTEYGWSWYGKLVGGRFSGHGPVEEETVEIVDRGHPSTRHLPQRWTRRDEWYRHTDMAPDLHVLARLKDSDDPARPIAWCHEHDGGRSWYTAGGHTDETFSEPLFLEHLLGGIVWAMGKDYALGSR
jgi:type 1 glutamine amidotransferase